MGSLGKVTFYLYRVLLVGKNWQVSLQDPLDSKMSWFFFVSVWGSNQIKTNDNDDIVLWWLNFYIL